jgi:uncharacterized membrane protein
MPTQDKRADEHPVIRNVEEIARFEKEEVRVLPFGERISLAVTNAAGTPECAAIHLVFFAVWLAWNVTAPNALRFDPYPFGFLTMFVSMEAVILAIFVLITQNRMSAQTDRRDHLDLQVDLLAEQEMTMMLRMLDKISDRLGVAPDTREQDETRKLMEHTNVYELLEELRRKFH